MSRSRSIYISVPLPPSLPHRSGSWHWSCRSHPDPDPDPDLPFPSLPHRSGPKPRRPGPRGGAAGAIQIHIQIYPLPPPHTGADLSLGALIWEVELQEPSRSRSISRSTPFPSPTQVRISALVPWSERSSYRSRPSRRCWSPTVSSRPLAAAGGEAGVQGGGRGRN